MADRVGFEPTVPLQVRRISSAVPSTTRPPVRRPEYRSRRGKASRFGTWLFREFTLPPKGAALNPSPIHGPIGQSRTTKGKHHGQGILGSIGDGGGPGPDGRE